MKIIERCTGRKCRLLILVGTKHMRCIVLGCCKWRESFGAFQSLSKGEGLLHSYRSANALQAVDDPETEVVGTDWHSADHEERPNEIITTGRTNGL